MPRASVWLIRLALLHLLAGAVIGTLYLAFKAGGWFPGVAAWRPAHVEMVLVGWMVQLVIGVAWWILPRTAEGVAGEGRVVWAVFGLINAGVILAALGTMPGFPPVLTVAGRGAAALAAGLFALIAWNRQRPYRVATRKTLV